MISAITTISKISTVHRKGYTATVGNLPKTKHRDVMTGKHLSYYWSKKDSHDISNNKNAIKHSRKFVNWCVDSHKTPLNLHFPAVLRVWRYVVHAVPTVVKDTSQVPNALHSLRLGLIRRINGLTDQLPNAFVR